MAEEQKPQPLALVKQELPTIEKILSLSAPPGVDVATIALQEFMYLEALAQSKRDILDCSPQSLLLAVKSVMQKNLTLDPQAGLVYVKTRSVNVGTEQQKKWIKVVEMMPSVNGLISINRQLGRILDYTNPVVKKDVSGKVIGVSMSILKPSFGQPRWELYEYDESDFLRWRRASHKDNGRNKSDANHETLNYANPNYTNFNGGIDPEFARAKCIRHSLKKLGTNPQEGHAKIMQPVQQEMVVDPEKDEYTEYSEQHVYADHVEINSTTNQDTETNDASLNDDEL